MPRTRIYFSGTVQGVGFRYQAKIAARQFPVTGWVRNLSDGRVEVLVEGTRSDLEALIAQIESRMEGYVSGKIVTWENESGEFVNFEIAPTA